MCNRSEQNLIKAVGNRCNICTGCGRCPGVGKGLSVIMDTSQSGTLQSGIVSSGKNELWKGLSLSNREGKRLVTVDIGTTTIAMQLYHENGSIQDSFAGINPQTKYGADVLSRIQASEKPENAKELQLLVRGVLKQGLERFKRQLAEGETLYMVIAANTTMVYLLMGYDARELGQAPFTASHLETVHAVIEDVPCVIFPGFSAFVGGDIVSGVHACGLAEEEKLTLLIDLGTNGEMVLGNRERIMACATAAGPAFEGGVNRGVWGADMVSLLARMKKEGVMDETGLLADPYFDSGVRICDVCVTQAAVRAVQLAKGAVAAGIHILTKEYGAEFKDIKRVVLAGGFGYYLIPEAAANIGLLPEELTEKTVTGGNTALAGALRLGRELLIEKKEVDFQDGNLWRKQGLSVEILNLAKHPDFEKIYFDAMEFK